MFQVLLLLGSAGLLADGGTQGKQYNDGHHDADGQADPCVLDKACDDEVHEAQCCNGDRIRKLGLDMLDVVAVCTGGSHDGGVGDR